MAVERAKMGEGEDALDSISLGVHLNRNSLFLGAVAFSFNQFE